MKTLFWASTIPFHFSVILIVFTNPNTVFFSYALYFIGWLVWWCKQARKKTSQISFVMLWAGIGIIFLSGLVQGFSIGTWLFQ